MSLLHYAAYLESEIRNLNLQHERPILMGHSMGGLLAQILASRGLAKVLVALTPAPPAWVSLFPTCSMLKSFCSALTGWLEIDSAGKARCKWARELPLRGFWKKPYLPTFNEAKFSMLEKVESEVEQRKIHGRLVYESGKAATEIAFWLFYRKPRPSHVDKVRCPMLFIAAKDDKITPAKFVVKNARKYGACADPDAPKHYKVFPNHAHWVLGEPNWKEIALYVEAWLRRVL